MEAAQEQSKPTPAFLEHTSREELAERLARDIAYVLQKAIETDGKATLCVSGGSTPKLLFRTLASQIVDWQYVTVTLVDDRWVSPDNNRSNVKLVRDNLLTGPAAAARIAPITTMDTTPEEGLDEVVQRGSELSLPFEVVILGMGTDGHTASWFPGGDNLARATNPEDGALYETMRAPGAGEPRITLTLPPIISARHLILHIEGSEKRTVFEKALEDGPADEMPIRHVLRHSDARLHVYWAP